MSNYIALFTDRYLSKRIVIAYNITHPLTPLPQNAQDCIYDTPQMCLQWLSRESAKVKTFDSLVGALNNN